MHSKTAIKKLLKIGNVIIKNVYFEAEKEEEIFVVEFGLYSRDKERCPHCGRKCKKYDNGKGMRRWRSLDFGTTKVFIEAEMPRIKCPNHGVIAQRVPWARHKSDFTKDFEQAVTWFCLHATATDVSEYFRIDWHSVGNIAKRVGDELESQKITRFDNLIKIGIDETSYKKGHKYMTVIVNHETGNLIWAKKGHGKEILESFFKELSEEQRTNIKLVSADGARWIADCIRDFCPNAKRCVDPFHVVQWANDTIDKVRKVTVRAAKKDAADGAEVKGGKKNEQRKVKQKI